MGYRTGLNGSIEKTRTEPPDGLVYVVEPE
jgi:hypothetical protein